MQDLVVEIQDPVAEIRLPRRYLVQGMRMDMLDVARRPGSAASTGLNLPPFIHKNFKTSNVLVDENFIANVVDAELVRLIRGYEDVGSSHGFSSSVYQDPESLPDGCPTPAASLTTWPSFSWSTSTSTMMELRDTKSDK